MAHRGPLTSSIRADVEYQLPAGVEHKRTMGQVSKNADNKGSRPCRARRAKLVLHLRFLIETNIMCERC